MEQRVPSSWLNSLTAEQQDWLATWQNHHGYAEPLSVGQLIHFLIEHKQPLRIEYRPDDQRFSEVWTRYDPHIGWQASERHAELLNSLWRHVLYLLDHPRTYRR